MYPRIFWELVSDPLGMHGAHFGDQLSRCLIHVRKKKNKRILFQFAQIVFSLNRFPFHYFTPLTFPASDSTSATVLSTIIFAVTFREDFLVFVLSPHRLFIHYSIFSLPFDLLPSFDCERRAYHFKCTARLYFHFHNFNSEEGVSIFLRNIGNTANFHKPPYFGVLSTASVYCCKSVALYWRMIKKA
jgi:hypothetical protein